MHLLNSLFPYKLLFLRVLKEKIIPLSLCFVLELSFYVRSLVYLSVLLKKRYAPSALGEGGASEGGCFNL